MLRKRLLSKITAVFIVLVLLATAAVFIYSVINPAMGERFTEFYLLDSNGKAEYFPETLKAGEEVQFQLGIINREQQAETYRVEIVFYGTTVTELDSIRLEDGEAFEKEISFPAGSPGDNQRVEFLLFKQGEEGVYRELYLWVDVTE